MLKDDAAHNESIPHDVSLAVWDVSSPCITDQLIDLKVGVKCSLGCSLAGELVSVVDEAGHELGRSPLSEEPWPNTTALYWAGIAAHAPERPGRTDWHCVFQSNDPESPHGRASTAVQIHVVPVPQHTIHVRVLGALEPKTPLAGAEVRVGAFRGATEECGNAVIAVPGGVYEITAWKLGFIAASLEAAITADAWVVLELRPEPEVEHEYWMG